MKRREALKYLGGGAATLGSGKAVDNVLLGYGTNLRSQDLAAVADEHLSPATEYATATEGYRIARRGDRLAASEPEGDTVVALSIPETTPEEAARRDAELGLEAGPLEQIVADVRAIDADEHAFEFHSFESFFDRLDEATARPFTADLLRGSRAATPESVSAFTGVSPARPRAVLEDLVAEFRDHSSYDVPRYVAGAITDNVLLGAVKLRKHFRSDVDDFRSIEANGGTGMFCYEFTRRSIEAIHAVPAHRQRSPVVGATVRDYRHKHVYTAVASAIRDASGRLVVPVTFVDYTHTTLYDDFGLTPVLGEGFDAYNDRHRADDIFWDS